MLPSTSTIGPDCHEVFLPLPDHPRHPFKKIQLQMAGLSRLRPPYWIRRPEQNMRLLMCTLSGRGVFRVNGCDGEFLPGSAWLITGGQSVWYEIAGAHWDIFWFHFSPLPADAPESRLLPGFPRLLPALMQGYLDEFGRSRQDREDASEQYADLIALTLERLLAPGGGGETLPGVSCIPDFAASQPAGTDLHQLWAAVEREPGAAWSVEELARRLHLSAPHLHRLCRQRYGRAPMELVTMLRMQQAQRRLSLPDCKLDALAAELGYSTAFSFSRAFKKHAGMSPSEFRNRRHIF